MTSSAVMLPCHSPVDIPVSLEPIFVRLPLYAGRLCTCLYQRAALHTVRLHTFTCQTCCRMGFSLGLCVDVGVGGILLYELAAGFYVVSHQHGEDLVGISGILDGYLFQQACLGIHGRLP